MLLPVLCDFHRLASCAAQREADQVATVIQAKFKLMIHGNEHATTPSPGTQNLNSSSVSVSMLPETAQVLPSVCAPQMRLLSICRLFR